MDRKKFFLISLLISVLTSVLLIAFTADKRTLDAVLQIRLEFIFMAAFVHLLSFFLTAKKTKHLCFALGSKISTKKAFLNVMTGIFMAALTPSSIGGEPIRILLLKANANVPVGKGTAVIIMERVLDAFFIIGLLIPSLWVVHEYAQKTSMSSAVTNGLLGISVSCIFIVGALFIYMLKKPDKATALIQKTMNFINRITKKRYNKKIEGINMRIGGEIDLFCKSFYTFLRSGKISLLFSLIYTVLSWMAHLMALWFILKGLNYTQSFWSVAAIMFATQIVLLIVMLVPSTPGSSGVAELGAFSLYSLFVPGPILAVVVIAWRGITYYVNILAGFLASMIAIKKYGANILSEKMNPLGHPKSIEIEESKDNSDV